jgi:hypothetical protein
MLFAPNPRPAVEHTAVFTFPPPTSAMALQPLIVAPFALNATMPVGPLPETVAVSVTVSPTFTGFAELASETCAAVGPAIVTLTSLEGGLSCWTAS